MFRNHYEKNIPHISDELLNDDVPMTLNMEKELIDDLKALSMKRGQVLKYFVVGVLRDYVMDHKREIKKEVPLPNSFGLAEDEMINNWPHIRYQKYHTKKV